MPATKVVMHQGQSYVVPADDDGFVHEEDLRGAVGISPGATMYHDTPDGHHALIKPGSRVALPDGASLDHINRAQAAGRNVERLSRDIAKLRRRYGASNVGWAKDYEWITVSSYRLPPSYNKKTTDIALMVPPGYGEGEAMRDCCCFVTPGLRYCDQGQWKAIGRCGSGAGSAVLGDRGEHVWSYLDLPMPRRSYVRTVVDYLEFLYNVLEARPATCAN